MWMVYRRRRLLVRTFFFGGGQVLIVSSWSLEKTHLCDDLRISNSVIPTGSLEADVMG